MCYKLRTHINNDTIDSCSADHNPLIVLWQIVHVSWLIESVYWNDGAVLNYTYTEIYTINKKATNTNLNPSAPKVAHLIFFYVMGIDVALLTGYFYYFYIVQSMSKRNK